MSGQKPDIKKILHAAVQNTNFTIVWYFTEDPRLSLKALEAFQSSETEGIVFVPAVVLAEIMFISKKGRVTLSFDNTLRKIEESENFIIAPLREQNLILLI